jgi:hypothetical protein
MESQTQRDWKYRPAARVVALVILTTIVLGIDRTLVRWLPPSLSWSISAGIWALAAVAMFSFFARLSGKSQAK